MSLSADQNYYIESLSEPVSTGMKHEHIHDFYEILFMLEGERRFFINHTLYNLVPYDVILVNKGDVHLSQSVKHDEKYSRKLITFNDAFLESLGTAFNPELLLRPFHSVKIHIPDSLHKAFNSLIHKAEMKMSNSDDMSQYIVKLCIVELLVNLNQCASLRTSPLMDEITVYEDHIQDACRYICNFYNQPITLEQMAKVAYMSPTYFSRKFKLVTGFGFKEYLNLIRCKMATNLLMETQYSITEIAQYCGYHDSNYFGDVFKRIVGMSPNRYRKEHYIL